MSREAMDAACPGHRYLGRGRLPGHRLAFTRRSVRTGTGVADAVADSEHEVWGARYEIEDADLVALDQKEGAGWAYERRAVRVHADDGSVHDVLAYVVISRDPAEIPPSADYGRRLTEAARERGLPELYVEALTTLLAALGT